MRHSAATIKIEPQTERIKEKVHQVVEETTYDYDIVDLYDQKIITTKQEAAQHSNRPERHTIAMRNLKSSIREQSCKLSSNRAQ